MINFFFTWLSFVVLLMSFSEELDLIHFTLLSNLMFYFTYFYNQIKPTVLSKKITFLLFNVPIAILWYVIFIYNDFLSITPISCEMFINLFLTYFLISFISIVNFLSE